MCGGTKRAGRDEYLFLKSVNSDEPKPLFCYLKLPLDVLGDFEMAEISPLCPFDSIRRFELLKGQGEAFPFMHSVEGQTSCQFGLLEHLIRISGKERNYLVLDLIDGKPLMWK